MKVLKLMQFAVLATAAMYPMAAVYAADFSAVADTYTDTARPKEALGASGVLGVANGRAALIKFNPSQLAQSTGNSASLKVKVLLTKNASNAVSVRLVLGNWNEATVTASTLPPISSTPLDQQTILRSNEGGIVSFDVSAALAGWRSNPASNFGLAIVASTPVPNLQLGSREGGAPAVLSVTGESFTNEVTVSPTGGDYADPAAAAKNATAGDSWCHPSANNPPCTIHVARGIYAVKESIELPLAVALVGEEKGDTLILSSADPVVRSAGQSTISDLTIRGPGIVLASSAAGARAPTLARVSLTGGEGEAAVNVYYATGTFSITDSEIVVRDPDASSATGVSVQCYSCDGALRVVRSTLQAIGGQTALGIVTVNGGLDRFEVVDSTIQVESSSTAQGIFVGGSPLAQSFLVQGSHLIASGPTQAIGVYGTRTQAPVQLIDTTVGSRSQGQAFGVFWPSGALLDGVTVSASDTAIRITGYDACDASVLRSQLEAEVGLQTEICNVTVESSTLKGSIAALSTTSSPVAIASSQVAGTIANASPAPFHCDRVYDANLILLSEHCRAP